MQRIMFLGVLLAACAGAEVARIPIAGWTSIPPHESSVERYAEMRDAGFSYSLTHFSTLAEVLRALDAAQAADFWLEAGDAEIFAFSKVVK